MSIAAQFRTQGKKVVAVARNYAANAAELSKARADEPFVFLKPTSSYTQGDLELPDGVTCVHEVELGVVIGKAGKDIKAEDAYKHVAGYCLAIDYTARNVQDRAKAAGLPWTAAKGFDTFCPVGDFIDAKCISDPHNLRLWYKINDEVKQSESTNLMLRKIPALIEHCSSIMCFDEGDLLLTGTPAGVGFVNVGDKISAGLEQDGKTLSIIEHLVRNRKGGYLFKP